MFNVMKKQHLIIVWFTVVDSDTLYFINFCNNIIKIIFKRTLSCPKHFILHTIHNFAAFIHLSNIIFLVAIYTSIFTNYICIKRL